MIQYDAGNRVFRLDNGLVTYAFGVAGEGRLVHLYYGAPLPADTETNRHLRELLSLSWHHSSNDPVFEDVKECCFSPNVSMMEYPTKGIGDYRATAFSVRGADGTDTTDLRYLSHAILPGAAAPEGLPHLRLAAEKAETLAVTAQDPISGTEVTLYYVLPTRHGVIGRFNRISNHGPAALTVEEMASASLTLPEAGYDAVHLCGHYPKENVCAKDTLGQGRFCITSTRGETGHSDNPFLALTEKNATEEQGEVYAFSLLYSGSFAIVTERAYNETVRINLGIASETFRWLLEPGEYLDTPYAVLLYTGAGLGGMTRAFHRLWKDALIPQKWVHTPRPLLINSWEAVLFDFDDEKLLEFARSAKDLGMEMLVMDDGWFSHRRRDDSSLGDWWVNEEKLRGGLRHLVERVHALGMKFGIWFEPEMISPDSDLYRAHPEYAIQVKGRISELCRHQLTLDVGQEEVQEEILSQMFRVLDGSGVDYVKWDYNRPMTEAGSLALPPERQGEVQHRCMLGTYRMLSRLTERYPDLLLETCASGGGRFDAGMLFYSPQIWTSDQTDGADRVDIQMGTSLCYPPSAMGAHVSAHPRTGYAFKGVVAMLGTFGYELNLPEMGVQELDLFRKQVERYHRLRHIVQDGELYRLVSPWEKTGRVAYLMVTEDKREALLTALSLRFSSACKWILKLCGLCADARYLLEETGEIYTGAYLMQVGMNLTNQPENYTDYTGALYHLQQVKNDSAAK